MMWLLMCWHIGQTPVVIHAYEKEARCHEAVQIQVSGKTHYFWSCIPVETGMDPWAVEAQNSEIKVAP